MFSHLIREFKSSTRCMVHRKINKDGHLLTMNRVLTLREKSGKSKSFSLIREISGNFKKVKKCAKNLREF